MDIDIPASSCKQLRSSVVTSDAETSTIEEEINELENSNEKSDVWCKTDKKPNNEAFIGTTGLNIVIKYFVRKCRSVYSACRLIKP
jgi:hypothetical protein